MCKVTRALAPTALAVALVGLGVSPPTALAASSGGFMASDPRPPGCAWRFKDPNPRERVLNRATYLHEMSNPPTCSPHGPTLGQPDKGSHFTVYYADPREPLWCYGYSVQLNRTGYIRCDAY
jgi:hypothetical protein